MLEARPQGKVWAVRLEAVSDRDRAPSGGSAPRCWPSGTSWARPARDCHYWADLEGLPVVTVDGRGGSGR